MALTLLCPQGDGRIQSLRAFRRAKQWAMGSEQKAAGHEQWTLSNGHLADGLRWAKLDLRQSNQSGPCWPDLVISPPQVGPSWSQFGHKLHQVGVELG